VTISSGWPWSPGTGSRPRTSPRMPFASLMGLPHWWRAKIPECSGRTATRTRSVRAPFTSRLSGLCSKRAHSA
jgi:hypothetical protein